MTRRSGTAKRDDTSERALLRAIRARAAAGRMVRIGIGDDCAVLTTRPSEEIVVTTDFSIEGRHFHLATHPPEAIGHKCLARGLSDIAAMGARPSAAFLSLAMPGVLTLPRGKRDSWMARFYDGLLALAEREGVTLAGGDLSEAPLAVADITVIGRAAKGRALLRSTARDGDILYVTGTLGGAAMELAALDAKHPIAREGTTKTRSRYPLAGLKQSGLEQQGHPHFFPQPRLAAGWMLAGANTPGRRGAKRLATACIDISDGLSVDLLHLCEESGLSAEVDAAAIPLAGWEGSTATLKQALHGGDDYELLFTARPATHIPERLKGLPVRQIGRMVEAHGASRLTLVTTQGSRSMKARLQARGWEHF